MRRVPAQIDIEDFRVVTESYGMQLNDDSILAIFSKVCAIEYLHARLVLLPALVFLHLLQAKSASQWTPDQHCSQQLCMRSTTQRERGGYITRIL